MSLLKKVIIVMGVSGCGKSTVAQLLAERLDIPYIDADDHHPPANIEKMSQGIPLVDSDRMPWLDKIHQLAQAHLEEGCVIACSALKAAYRKRLARTIEPHVFWVYLEGSYDQIFERMKKRKGHFMDADMLRSQFEALEPPTNVFSIDISFLPDVIANEILSELKK